MSKKTHRSTLYHGSPRRLTYLKPQPHYLADYTPVVFATPLRSIALASLQPWNDTIFEQGVVNEDPPYMMELRPDAFREIYGGKRGYLYSVDPESFYWNDRLARYELISEHSPQIYNVEVVEDALSALEESNMQMIYFEDASAFIENDYRKNPISRPDEGSAIEVIDGHSPHENFDNEDLRGANLKGTNLRHSSFRNADLRGATLYDCNLSHCDFTGANLDGASFASARVKGAIFADCSMNATLLFDLEALAEVEDFSPTPGSALAGCVLDIDRRPIRYPDSELRSLDGLRKDDEFVEQYIELILSLLDIDSDMFPEVNPQVILSGKGGGRRQFTVLYTPENANLRYLFRYNTDLRGFNLRGANFRGSELEVADFRNAQLQGADFTDTILKEVVFWEAELQGADFQGSDLFNCSFYKADLQGVDFRNTTIAGGTSFVWSNLEGADFRNASMSAGSSFNSATLTDTDFRDLDINMPPDKRINLKWAYIKNTKFSIPRKEFYRHFDLGGRSRPYNVIKGIESYIDWPSEDEK